MELLWKINTIVWGIPTLVLILGTGIYLSFRTKFSQVTLFSDAMRFFIRKIRDPGQDRGISSFQALCTALSATVGTGNIAGVAGAIALGGPGAMFWMWISAFFGMILKYSEAVLSVRYRQEKNGQINSGPMYVIEQALPGKLHWLGKIYCVFGVIAAFGVGNATQVNTMITGITEAAKRFGWETSDTINLYLGIILSFLVFTMLQGGAKRIGETAEILVPFASLAYIILCIGALVWSRYRIPYVFTNILRGAFSPRAITGGAVGSALISLRTGMSRGIFTNEAGMGTAGIAHGSAMVSHPAEQGLMGIMEVFLDTIVMCTLTGLVILCSEVDIPYGVDEGMALTDSAICLIYGDWASIILTLFICCFALATILGWGLYGIKCVQYLFGQTYSSYYAIAQGIMVVVGATMKTNVLWLVCETVNGLMVIPNLIVMLLLSPELIRLTNGYKALRAPLDNRRI